MRTDSIVNISFSDDLFINHGHAFFAEHFDAEGYFAADVDEKFACVMGRLGLQPVPVD